MPSAPENSLRWVQVARVEDVPPGQVRRVEAEGRALALVNRDGEFFALSAVCPHQGGPLDQGSLWHGALECPWHHFRFDLATGRNLYPANVYPDDLPQLKPDVVAVPTFPVEQRGAQLYVGLPETHAGTAGGESDSS
jgi:3-phenylpropionate/trans-cinnamate dioxygenase ferredoxin subunit